MLVLLSFWVLNGCVLLHLEFVMSPTNPMLPFCVCKHYFKIESLNLMVCSLSVIFAGLSLSYPQFCSTMTDHFQAPDTGPQLILIGWLNLQQYVLLSLLSLSLSLYLSLSLTTITTTTTTNTTNSTTLKLFFTNIEITHPPI